LVLWETVFVRSRHCGWLAAWKTITIHAARPNITTIGITMGAILDPVILDTSSACACRFQRLEGRCC
jgi:hypothetical protein